MERDDVPRAIGRRRCAPPFVEHIEKAGGRRCGIRRLAIQLLREAKLQASDVGDRKMRERKIAQFPRGPCLPIGRNDANAKERDLESVTTPILRAQMPRVVPPLGAIFVVRAVVPRKLEVVAGKGGREIG